MDLRLKMKFETVDEYFSSLPETARIKLEMLRKIIRNVVPGAAELISYNMPAFRFHGLLLYFAAHKEHIGFYPGNTMAIEMFKKELTGYRTSKGTIQLPLDKDLPVTLIENIIRFRVQQNLERATTKIKKKK